VPNPDATDRAAGSWANPLASNPFATRDDVQAAVHQLTEPLRAFTSASGARVRLGSFGAAFEPRVAELEGFARPLYGVVPLVVGGGRFDDWGRIVSGLEAGTDPDHPDYWGSVAADGDQRMVEQAAIGLALAFCPDQVWEPLSTEARRRLADWLGGIFSFEPVDNNWQFFRVLVALGLERVGVGFDTDKLAESLARIETYRRGQHAYVDGALGNVDYYGPFALHTYGLMYVAANRLGLGDDAHAAAYAERAAGFAGDFAHWFGPDGAAIALGRSLTYRFALAAFWGAMAWADVASPDVSWGAMRGLLARHLRWWTDKAISDRDGVLSVGFTYDNRVLCESYNSAGSPYWALKAFAGLAAPADHPFWTEPEQPLASLDTPVVLPDAGWVVARDRHQATALVAQEAWDLAFPEQAAAKYRKFAYSSAFGFSGDVADLFGATVTDSMLALTDGDGTRRVRLGVQAAGVGDGLAWSCWTPWANVRIDTVCWAIDASWHGRVHRIRTGRSLDTVESGFAVAGGPEPDALRVAPERLGDEQAVFTTPAGATTAVFGLPDVNLGPLRSGVRRRGAVRAVGVNANLYVPHAATALLTAPLPAGDHVLACAVYAHPHQPPAGDDPRRPVRVPDHAAAMLESIAAKELA
jgi:hypothetical protein